MTTTNESVVLEAIAEENAERIRRDNHKAVELVRRISSLVAERDDEFTRINDLIAEARAELAKLSPSAPLTAKDIMG